MEVKEERMVSNKYNSESLKHIIEKKLVSKGVQRLERHPSDGLSLTHLPKSGHGGKYTWEGPTGPDENELKAVPPSINQGDPNYEEHEEDGGDSKELVVGEVEVAKAAENKEGVARVEIHPPLQIT